MKNILLIVADSLRLDAYQRVFAELLKKSNLPITEYNDVKCENSCTDLSLPWMLSGMEVFSPNISIPTDLKKLGYSTTLIHSNPVVHRFARPFDRVLDLSINDEMQKKRKKYNRIRHVATQILPIKWYNVIERTLFGRNDKYLPYTRVPAKINALKNIDNEPQFVWFHLMDPHTPYFPRATDLEEEKLIDINDNQISAVRGYYKPSVGEVTTWFNLYLQEIREMAEDLVTYLQSLDYSETTVIFTSDHGEEFGEHGNYGHKGNRFNPENVNVPFFVIGEYLPNTKISSHRELRGLIYSIAKNHVLLDIGTPQILHEVKMQTASQADIPHFTRP